MMFSKRLHNIENIVTFLNHYTSNASSSINSVHAVVLQTRNVIIVIENRMYR